MNNKILPFLLPIGFGIMGGAFADSSPRIYFAQTGSYYQEFYMGAIDERKTWHNAVADCKARKGHLVTITSKAESDFLNTQTFEYANRFLIGASDEIVEGQWKWITGETWNFTNWGTGEPDTYPGYDYAYFFGSNAIGNQYWATTVESSYLAYVCEWESDYVLDNAQIGDMTGDGRAEIGVYKLVKGVRTVNLINPVSGSSVGKLTFGSAKSIETSFIAPVNDMNGNGKPDVALVTRRPPKGYLVTIKDSTNNAVTLKSFYAASDAYDLLSMASVPDLNGDGVSELQFLTRSTVNGANQLSVRNPKTGGLIKTLVP